MPYERKLPFVANSYMPFGQEAYERGRHYVHIWKSPKYDRWKFRIYRYGRPKTELVKAAKRVLAEMNAPMSMLGVVGATEADWTLWVEKTLKNKYNYTWTEFYFSEHGISSTSPWTTKAEIRGPLWADVDPLSYIDMRIYDNAEKEFRNLQEYESRVVAEDWIDDFTSGKVEEVSNALYEAIKNAPLSQQILCPSCYRYNPVDPTMPFKMECRYCGEDIDIGRAKKRKKTLTYDTIKDYVSKRASLKLVRAQEDEYWIAILGNGTKFYDSEESLLRDVKNDIDSLTAQTIAEEAKKMLMSEMPSLEKMKEAANEKFEEIEQEQQEEEYALVASVDNYRQVNRLIESIDQKGFSKEANYLRSIISKRI